MNDNNNQLFLDILKWVTVPLILTVSAIVAGTASFSGFSEKVTSQENSWSFNTMKPGTIEPDTIEEDNLDPDSIDSEIVNPETIYPKTTDSSDAHLGRVTLLEQYLVPGSFGAGCVTVVSLGDHSGEVKMYTTDFDFNAFTPEVLLNVQFTIETGQATPGDFACTSFISDNQGYLFSGNLNEMAQHNSPIKAFTGTPTREPWVLVAGTLAQKTYKISYKIPEQAFTKNPQAAYGKLSFMWET